MKGVYKGFSSKNYHREKTFKTNDLALVKEDLLNHIFTRLGSRVKMPTFGTRIPDLLFAPLDDSTLSIVKEDFYKVFTYDPRVELLSLSVVPLYGEHTILVVAELYYIELSMSDRMDVTIDLGA